MMKTVSKELHKLDNLFWNDYSVKQRKGDTESGPEDRVI